MWWQNHREALESDDVCHGPTGESPFWPLVIGHWFQRFRKNPRLRHKNHADRQAEILRVSCELTERLHNRALWWKTVVCGTGKSGTWRHHQSNADQICVQLLTTLMGRCINAYLETIFHVHFFPGPKSIGNKISIDRNDLHIAGYLYHLLCTSPHGFFV